MSIHQLSAPGNPPARILIIDSDDQDRHFALRVLEPLARRFTLVEAASASSWYEASDDDSVIAVICAHQLEFSDGVSVLQTMRLLHPECFTVLLGVTDALQARTALASGAVDEVISKNAQGWVSLLRTLNRQLSEADPASEPAAPTTVESAADTTVPSPDVSAGIPVTDGDLAPTQQRAWAQSDAAMSHDMRDWVQLIGHRATTLSGRESVRQDTQAQHDLRRIQANVVRLQDVLDKVFSKQQSHEEEEVGAVALDEVVAEIADQLCLAQPKMKVEIDFRNLPAVTGERTALYRLFDNLIRNAIRHAEQSPVRVRVRATLSAEAHLISVSDNGPGIASDQLEKVFEPHFRAPESQNKPGSGIGLTTCREIVKSMGGAIWIESPRRRGITVFIRLPAHAHERFAEADS